MNVKSLPPNLRHNSDTITANTLKDQAGNDVLEIFKNGGTLTKKYDIFSYTLYRIIRK